MGRTRLLASLLGCASMFVSGGAVPGDCTALEIASYRIDPRSVLITDQATCIARDGLTVADGVSITNLCNAIDVPRVAGSPELARSPDGM